MTHWLAGYAMTVYDKHGAPLAVYYAPTMAEGEQQIVNDIQMGAWIEPPTTIHCEWLDELIPAETWS